MIRRNFLTLMLAFVVSPAFGATQADRRAFMDKLIKARVFSKVGAANGVSKVWTGPAFRSLDFESKNSFCGVVFAYYQKEDGSNKTLRVIDGDTNKEVGVFAETYGGLKLH